MVGMIINISDRKDTKFLSYNNTLSVEIKFLWLIIAFFLLYRWHSYINNVSLFKLGGNSTDVADRQSLNRRVSRRKDRGLCFS